MRKPSRMMPSKPSQSITPADCLVLASFGAAFLALVYTMPFLLIPMGGFALVTVVMTFRHDRRLARRAAGRKGESICTLARSFDYRAIDTWVIRAVFEELQFYCRFGGGTLPLRASDDLYNDLCIDPEDLNDLAADMAFRAGRSFEDRDCEKNPHYGKVQTVADLVVFLVNQPRKQVA
jgi:hypothetical protein